METPTILNFFLKLRDVKSIIVFTFVTENIVTGEIRDKKKIEKWNKKNTFHHPVTGRVANRLKIYYEL